MMFLWIIFALLLCWDWSGCIRADNNYGDSWPGQEVSNGLCWYGDKIDCCWGWTRTSWGLCQPLCQLECKHGFCVGPDKCKCHPGYTGKGCNQDVNECGLKPRPCKHRCMNTHGSYKCYCLNGYMLQPDGICRSARTCSMANCQYGCEFSKGEVQCQCPSPGLRLGPDRRTCVDIDECVTGRGVCPQNRKCKNTFGSYVCKCYQGYKLTYINGKYQCIDKDSRSFCSLNPDSPRCHCRGGKDCHPVAMVTIEPPPLTAPTTTTKPTVRTTPRTTPKQTTRTTSKPTPRPTKTTTFKAITTTTTTRPATMTTIVTTNTIPKTVPKTTPTTQPPTTTTTTTVAMTTITPETTISTSPVPTTNITMETTTHLPMTTTTPETTTHLPMTTTTPETTTHLPMTTTNPETTALISMTTTTPETTTPVSMTTTTPETTTPVSMTTTTPETTTPVFMTTTTPETTTPVSMTTTTPETTTPVSMTTTTPETTTPVSMTTTTPETTTSVSMTTTTPETTTPVSMTTTTPETTTPVSMTTTTPETTTSVSMTTTTPETTTPVSMTTTTPETTTPVAMTNPTPKTTNTTTIAKTTTFPTTFTMMTTVPTTVATMTTIIKSVSRTPTTTTIPTSPTTAGPSPTTAGPSLTTTGPSPPTTLDNHIRKEVTQRPRGDVFIPRQPDVNYEFDFEIELGTTAEENQDDPAAGTLSCSFDHGLCGWIRNTDGGLHWEMASHPAGGQYLSVPELGVGKDSIRGARLVLPLASPWSKGYLCFSFRHWLSRHHVGVLQLFIRRNGKGLRYSPALWSRTAGGGWRHTQVNLGAGLESVSSAQRREEAWPQR
ncbi:hypothetical protein UPYG_G00243750 [Umbra pygmaea]|uniref:Nephronectin n=1 Tax=Umbra pygmaea TaxID=75934 RepID=A0ABD0WFV2_UMBPY